MGFQFPRIRSVVFIALLLSTAPAAAQFGLDLSLGQNNQAEPSQLELGDRVEGETYEIPLTAVNENCEQPQDFRFDFDAIPWMYPQGEDTVRGLRAGESGTIIAILDLSNVSVGQHDGMAEVHCATCQFLIFNTCNIDRRQLNFNVNVTPIDFTLDDEVQFESGRESFPQDPEPSSPPSSTSDSTPGTSAAGEATSEGAIIVGGTSSSGRTSTPATRAAYAEMARLAALKDPCAEELARLRTEHAAAAGAAAIAADEAVQAADDAMTAEQHLADYQDEMDAAQRAMDSTYRTLQMQAGYRTIVANESGTGSTRYAEADQLVNDANDAAVEAQRNYSNVRSSYDARQAAAEAARENADNKQADADAAQAAADAAAAALAAKELECQDLDRACIEAQGAATTAQAEADQEVADAAAAAAAQRELDAVNARNACESCLEELRRRSHILTLAFRAMRDNNMINPNRVSSDDVDLEGIVTDGYTTILVDGVATAVGAPTLQVFTMLDALTIAYHAVAILNGQHIPGTGLYRGDDIMKEWLQSLGHANGPREAEEVLRAIREFQNHNGNTDYLREQWERESARCLRLCVAAQEAEAAAAQGR